jgi:cell division septation protein DedD
MFWSWLFPFLKSEAHPTPRTKPVKAQEPVEVLPAGPFDTTPPAPIVLPAPTSTPVDAGAAAAAGAAFLLGAAMARHTHHDASTDARHHSGQDAGSTVSDLGSIGGTSDGGGTGVG